MRKEIKYVKVYLDYGILMKEHLLKLEKEVMLLIFGLGII